MMDKEKELRELLADYAHEAWSGWMKYMLPKLEGSIPSAEHLSWVTRWERQMNTPYAELSEEEKGSDRAEADKMLAIVKRNMT